MKRILTSLAALLIICLIFNGQAQSLKPVTKGITVSPAILQISASPHQNTSFFNVSITNNTEKSVVIFVKSNDFTAFGENGQVSFYTGNYNSAANPHGLAYWLHPSVSQVGLKPGASQVIPVEISNISKMAAGGHYGALNYIITAPSANPNKPSVSNNQVTSTLVFFKTAGPGDQTLNLIQSLNPGLSFKLPNSVQFVLSNVGNTQTSPHGYVTITKGSSLITKRLVNSGSGLVLPGSSRLFNESLSSGQYSFWGGQFKLTIAFRPDNSQDFRYYTKNFTVVGLVWPILICLIALALIYAGLRKRRLRRKGKLTKNGSKISKNLGQ